jgi:hypothetical protein
MDNTKTAKPLYSFDYILNPSKSWRDFKNLNIEIIPPKEAPYIVKSSVDLVRGKNKAYTAALPTLPEEDLSFSLYADKKITRRDKTAGILQDRFGYFTTLVIGAIIPLIGIIIAVNFLTRNKYN